MPSSSSSDVDADNPRVPRLLLLSLPSILNEAAPFISALLQTALLSHAGSTFRKAGRSYSSEEAVAAYGAVTQTTNFVTGLVNFLLMVVMAGVGKAVGRKSWRSAGRHVRLALPLALALGTAAGALLACLRNPLLEGVLRLSHDARAAADGFFYWRCACLPAAFVLKALVGVLGGFGMLGHLTAISVGLATLECGLAALSLQPHPFGGGSGSGSDDEEDAYVLASVASFGAATLVASSLAVVAGVTMVFTRTPEAARRHLRSSYCSSSSSSSRKGGAWKVGAQPHRASGNDHYAAMTGDYGEQERADGDGGGAEYVEGEEEDEEEEEEEEEEAFSPRQFIADAANTMVRSLLLQTSMWAMTVSAARLGTGALAAHQVVNLLWLVVSYVIDGLADLGTMFGSRLLGANRHGDFSALAGRLRAVGFSVGAVAAAVLWFGRETIQDALAPSATDDDHENGNNDDDDDDDDGSGSNSEMRRQLRLAWPLLAAMQLCNSLVFVYDGLLSAAGQFRFVRNVFLVGVPFLFTPVLALFLALGSGSSAGGGHGGALQGWAGTLAGIWAAKAALNVWRCSTGIWRIDFALPRRWRRERLDFERRGKGEEDGEEQGQQEGAGSSSSLSESLLPRR